MLVILDDRLLVLQEPLVALFHGNQDGERAERGSGGRGGRGSGGIGHLRQRHDTGSLDCPGECGLQPAGEYQLRSTAPK